MILRAAIFSLIAVSAIGQAFVRTNMVTRIPLPWGGEYTNVTRTHVRVPIQTLESTNDAPTVPSHLRAEPPKAVLLRWLYPPEETNVTWWIYRSTNLVSWAAYTNFPYSVRATALPNPMDARGFFTVCASNDAGQVCVPRVVR